MDFTMSSRSCWTYLTNCFQFFQEMRAMHDEIVKQKTAFQSRLQSRDDEIDRLRNQACIYSTPGRLDIYLCKVSLR